MNISSSRSSSICTALVLGSLVTGAASAADLSFLDVRLGGGALSNEFRGSSTTVFTEGNSQVSTTTSSGNDGRDADSNMRGQLQVVWGNLGPAGGLIIGGGIAANHARFENGDYDAMVTTPVIDVLIGYGIAVNPNWHFELTPFAGLGMAYYSVDGPNGSSTSKDHTRYVEYGGRLGTYYTFDNRFQLGVEVPYLVGRYDPDYDHDQGSDRYAVSDERRNEGFGVNVTLGTRF